ncbi:PLP-dependent aminotransferase family protein [Pseudomonas sp. S 311-6]|uniref:DNA-binding transcriptional MocR family regulator n=1 Tax=Kerstersia gyiorum TaxID=206506 RepID=A0A171KS88_9BURK|nr:PLP-dependent aminotransferase family protein [Kerstersia gyiorum]MCO7637775.1 PLP-dependent aminotransferase family protein [Pseudomonas sp. S 311-6]KAB0541575.1 PLP-dependent aminotransferase family protein [Kerstersia gyiorum]KKO71755.1 GntR family transcriptional regulator [Kerstersia gyiorum]MCR4158707.1 PLP-dependent aminotransferase family protein [Kerstersia gyiorum]RZS67290.1 DNA-binding transcriptional MocR family regulator [Kerstersia gyiorum]
MTDYRTLADAIAADIASGCLPPGSRLLPQRDFADRHGIAASTASRVYAELARRGLTSGEIGRGTYVRPAWAAPHPALSEPGLASVDLEMNIPVLAQANTMLADATARILQAGLFGHALQAVGTAAKPQARRIAAAFLAQAHWQPQDDSIFFTGNGRQAIAAALRALAAPGGRIGVESLSYPGIRGLASQLGITLVPLAIDAQGLVPDAILQTHAATPLDGLYLQPSLHNPLGCHMDTARRQAVATVLASTGLPAIEDAIYRFLVDDLPLAAYAPEQVIYVDSFSKRIAPGLTLGFASAPPALAPRLAASIRAGGVAAAGFPLALGLQLMSDGSARQIAALKRADAAMRQEIARQALAGLAPAGDPRAYHLWLPLPAGWRAENLVAAAARQGIAIAPGSAFAIASGHSPNAVRLALSAPPPETLRQALTQLRQILDAGATEID